VTARWGTPTWTELEADAAAPVVLVAVGSWEQHGPHLPLTTDTLIAEALVAAVAARRDGVLAGPTLTVTSSGEHAGFPGTLSVGAEVTESTVIELVRSADWSGGVLLVNGHGGNLVPVERAVTRLRSESRRVASWWPRLPGGDLHAGHTETSLLLHLHPELVRRDRIVAGHQGPLEGLLDELRAHGVRAVSPTGVLGDPTGADAETGAALFGRLVDDLLATLDAHRATWHGEPGDVRPLPGDR
jgi:creatinine amidohydrolase